MELLVVSNRRIDNGEYFASPDDLWAHLGYGDTEVTHLLFPFWSWKVDTDMLKRWKCYGMHTGFMLDGKGLGGSPFDNLQKLGVKWAALNVFEMNEVLDGGKVRLAIPINIEGTKEDFIEQVDTAIPDVVSFLQQDISTVPERFMRLKEAK